MTDASREMVAFVGIAPDTRLLDEDLFNLPDAERNAEPPVSTPHHERLVGAGSLLTGVTLVGGVVLALYGAGQLLLNGGGALDAAFALIGVLLAATHWGWVHVAEYVGVTLDEREQQAADQRRRDWLETIEPYPRFSIATSVLNDASTRIQRVLHQPILTAQGTFTFAREVEAEQTYDADASAETIATTVETMRRAARLETDRLHELWEAASSAYEAAMSVAHDDEQRLAAQRAAAAALSEHINASLLEPPLVE